MAHELFVDGWKGALIIELERVSLVFNGGVGWVERQFNCLL